jgi:hypothetical protein
MSENENDFDALRRLLALKRHEIPPPGYFENFSSQVIGRIRAGETAAELPFLLRFIQWFERRPALPVTFASSLCLVLLYGIVSVQQIPGMAGGFGKLGYVDLSTGGPTRLDLSTTTTSPTAVVDPSQPFNGASDQTNNPAANNPAYFNSQSAAPMYQQVSFSPAGN